MSSTPPDLEQPLANASDENRDLGFGSVVSRQRNLRLLNRDGSFNVGRKLGWWQYLGSYHGLLTMRWWKFIGLVVLAYFALNALFATAFLLCGPGTLIETTGHPARGEFLQAFFFSVETFGTIGYGNIIPVGITASLLMTTESLVGLLSIAVATGLVFARFSRPTADILFSEVAVIAPYRSETAFEFRIMNKRANQLIEVNAKVLFSRFEEQEGNRIRKYYPLALERQQVVFFPLSWTVVHPISNESPLFGVTGEDLSRDEAEFLILLTGIDETFSDVVHARSSYRANEVIWGAKFVNVLKPGPDGDVLTVDVSRFHDVEPGMGEAVLQLPPR
jgi:inward rectifier potassium channel